MNSEQIPTKQTDVISTLTDWVIYNLQLQLQTGCTALQQHDNSLFNV